MPLLPALVSVATIAFFSLWAAVPAGLAFGLHPAILVVVTSASYAAGVAIVLFPGERLRPWLAKRLSGTRAPNQNSPILRAWRRFGVLGLSLLAPVTTGAQLGALIGLSLNVPPRSLFLHMLLGGVIWSMIFTLAFMLGLLGIQAAA
jgi:uncharacterized membrane protein